MRLTLRSVAIIANLTLLGFMAYGLYRWGLPDDGAFETAFFLLMLAVPVINLVTFWLSSTP